MRLPTNIRSIEVAVIREKILATTHKTHQKLGPGPALTSLYDLVHQGKIPVVMHLGRGSHAGKKGDKIQ
jgi:hypothetical protein